MHIKFMAHGTGSGKSASDYLLKDKDHRNNSRKSVEILRGNPDHFSAVADSLNFEHKYRSAVIAWAPEDQPTPEQILGVLDDFQRVSFAGMNEARFAWTAVQHIEKGGGTHVHVLIARVDLETGKSFNPAPPGWQKSYYSVRDYHNAVNDWARPDDPARARQVQPGYHALKNASQIRAGLQETKDAKAILGDYIRSRILDGTVTNRSSVREVLSEIGQITREGKNYISVKPEGFDRAVRLKGGIFEREFNVNAAQKLEAEGPERTESRGDNRDYRAGKARKELERAVQCRAEYNQKRYPKRDESNQNSYTLGVAQDLDYEFNCHFGGGIGELGSAALPYEQYLGLTQDYEGAADRNEGNRIAEPDSRQLRPRRGVSHPQKRGEKAVCIQEQRGTMGSTSEIRQCMRNSNSEIERFKTEIDLSLYFEQNGCKKDNFASCRSSAVYRDDQGQKLIVGKKNGHFVYTNTKDSSDKGSIIDYVQRRTGANLGQVRRMLRPALKGDFTPSHEWAEPPEAMKKSQWTWSNTGPVFDSSYLQKRGIELETIQKYSARIHQTSQGNYLFGHYGPEGFSGFEIKSPGGKGQFSSGCEKSLFTCLTDQRKVSRIVVTETAIDALSYAQLDGCRDNTAYVSMAGHPSYKQLEQLKTLGNMDKIKEVVLAHDNDQGGHRQAEKCQKALAEVEVKTTRRVSESGKDWNDMVLQQRDQVQEYSRSYGMQP